MNLKQTALLDMTFVFVCSQRNTEPFNQVDFRQTVPLDMTVVVVVLLDVAALGLQ